MGLADKIGRLIPIFEKVNFEEVGSPVPDLNALSIFATVVESNSFSQASRRLNVPISTVSRRVAELEEELGVQLLKRSTRKLSLTEIGAEIFEHARHAVELDGAVNDIVGDHLAVITGTLRISSPPSVSDSLLAPLIAAVQDAHPQVRAQVFITERFVDLVSEGIDVAFIVGPIQDPALVSRTILSYRHQLLASPKYIDEHGSPRTPEELLGHRLLAFSFWRPENTWSFVNDDNCETRSISFRPYMSMNDYAGIVPRLLDGAGIGEIPPLVRPELVRDGHLVEVMPEWHFPYFDLKVVHHGGRYVPRVVRVFTETAQRLAPALFPSLPPATRADARSRSVSSGPQLGPLGSRSRSGLPRRRQR
jgi:DNA-binding transcriptional LysR family regulator